MTFKLESIFSPLWRGEDFLYSTPLSIWVPSGPSGLSLPTHHAFCSGDPITAFPWGCSRSLGTRHAGAAPGEPGAELRVSRPQWTWAAHPRWSFRAVVRSEALFPAEDSGASRMRLPFVSGTRSICQLARKLRVLAPSFSLSVSFTLHLVWPAEF